jgi:uncharacterized protein
MNWIRTAVFLLALSLFALSVTYLYRRLVRDVFRPGVPRRLGLVFFALLFLGVPLVRSLPFEAPNMTAAVLFVWGVALFSLLALVCLDIANKVRTRTSSGSTETVDEKKRAFLAQASAAAAVAIGTGTATFGAYRAFRAPEITEVPLRLPGLPKALDGFTIVQLSDIHVGAIIQARFVDTLVDQVNRQKPDLVALTGDLVDGRVDMLARYIARFSNLRSRYGTYAVSGNHDYYSGWPAWSQALVSMKFNVLRNRSVSIGEGNNSFNLIGVDDWGHRYSKGDYDLELATSGLDDSKASVLLAHQPQNLEAVSAKNIGLQLSGHTHGGQLFPATLIGDVVWGDRNAGLTKVGATHLYTSRGCGFVGVPMRVGAPPEIVKIVLQSGA